MVGTPWLTLSHRLGKQDSLAGALHASQLSWGVAVKPLFTEAGDTVRRVPWMRAATRDDDGRILGVVGCKYKPRTNLDSFRWVEPFLAAGELRLTAAGHFGNGDKVFLVARLEREPLSVAGVSVEKLLLLAHGHDRTVSNGCQLLPYVAAEGACLATATPRQRRLVAATSATGCRLIVDSWDEAFVAAGRLYAGASRRELGRKQLDTYIRRCIGAGKGELKTKALAKYEAIAARVEAPCSAWDAYRAVAGYLSRDVGYDAEARLQSLWWGRGAVESGRALTLATEV